MARQNYLTFREEDEGVLKYYILQKEFPHNLGLLSTQPNPDPIAQGTIAGYNLWIIWCGTLRGNVIAYYPNHEKDLQLVFDSMANWFKSERILKDEKRYDKFKIKKDVSTTGE